MCAIVGGGYVLWRVNDNGLPNSWRGELAEKLAERGIYSEISFLRWRPFQGFVADGLTIYSDSSRQHRLAHFRQLTFSLSRTRLLRGKIEVKRVKLSNSTISLPIDPADPASETLEIDNLRGKLKLLGQNNLHISRVSANIKGIDVQIKGVIQLPKFGFKRLKEEEEKLRKSRMLMLQSILNGIDDLELSYATPPQLSVFVTADLENTSANRANIALTAEELSLQRIFFKSLSLGGEIHGFNAILHGLHAQTRSGKLTASAEYDLLSHQGNIELQSTVRPIPFLKTVGISLPKELPSFSIPPQVDAHIKLKHEEGQGFLYHVIGEAKVTDTSYRGIHIRDASCVFSSDGKRTLIDDMRVSQDDKELRGRVLIEEDKVRYNIESSLPLEWWKKVIQSPKVIQVLDGFSESEKTENHVRFRGFVDDQNGENWELQGTVLANHFRYNDVPITEAEVNMDLNKNQYIFRQGTATFDYQNYPLRNRFGAPKIGTANFQNIEYDANNDLVTIQGLSGNVYPAPVVRLFSKEIADDLEAYKFHSPPQLSASGRVSTASTPKGQDLLVKFTSRSPMHYDFLGKEIQLSAVSAEVRTRNTQLDIRNLRISAFDGSLRGNLLAPFSKSQALQGSLDWTTLSLPKISSAYQFSSKPPGVLTGRLDFSLSNNQVRGFNGKGHMALEKGMLFDVPIFGPLSHLLRTVIRTKKISFQEANSAFLTFDIQDGILRSQDFRTTTSSLVFTGDGTLDLNQKTLNMIMRMNARGLLGLLTMPLKPMYGLFQFRGTGRIDAPQWEHVAFTSPPKTQNDRLLSLPNLLQGNDSKLSAPKARAVSP